MHSLVTLALVAAAVAAPVQPRGNGAYGDDYLVSLGPRPYYIINNMTDGPLKTKLQSCENLPQTINKFSIGHRGGGTLQFPEETKQSEDAGARMGAGVLECDVAFTADRGLVCRHSLCDLHTTTDILLRPELASKCTRPFVAANDTAEADALCCTSDITKDEFSSLCGKQDGFNASATTPEDYQHGTPVWRTELYDTCGTLLTLDEYIDLVDSYPGHRDFTPELKTPPAEVLMPFSSAYVQNYTQQQYAQDLVDALTLRAFGLSRSRMTMSCIGLTTTTSLGNKGCTSWSSTHQPICSQAPIT
jgi:glycerophosphoryl diester phosphodiesterase